MVVIGQTLGPYRVLDQVGGDVLIFVGNWHQELLERVPIP